MVHNTVPSNWPELAIKRLMPEVMNNLGLYSYYPDWTPSTRFVDRDFFWKVMYAVKPNYAKMLVADCIQQRTAHFKE